MNVMVEVPAWWLALNTGLWLVTIVLDAVLVVLMAWHRRRAREAVDAARPDSSEVHP